MGLREGEGLRGEAEEGRLGRVRHVLASGLRCRQYGHAITNQVLYRLSYASIRGNRALQAQVYP